MDLEREWRCMGCSALLGIERRSRLHLRYKEAQYIVDGGDCNVTAVCRKCSTINERSGRREPPQPVAAKK